jgi:sulfonate transport system ATP-binding protein
MSVALEGVSKAFPGRQVLDAFSLRIEPGELVALVGASGCGKTTILNLLAGLERPDAGTVRVAGEDGAPLRLGVVFQQPRLLDWASVRENVALASRDTAVAERMLREVGLGEHLDAFPTTLSGGQRQRAAVARAFSIDPELVLLDEPFSALDALTRVAAQRLVHALWERHRPAVLLVTHDVEECLLLADRVLLIEDGRLAYDEPFPLPRPRRRDHPELVARRRELLARLGVGDPT